MIDHFTKAEFEAALPVHKVTNQPLWTEAGLQSGEWCYKLPVSERIYILIRSSVHQAGWSADTGNDSIRFWPIDTATEMPAGSKSLRWVDRKPGWQLRMTNGLRDMYALIKAAGKCPTCGEPMYIYKAKQGKRKGEFFAKCQIGKCPGSFKWLQITAKPSLVEHPTQTKGA
jgi:hypothetical protein